MNVIIVSYTCKSKKLRGHLHFTL